MEERSIQIVGLDRAEFQNELTHELPKALMERKKLLRLKEADRLPFSRDVIFYLDVVHMLDPRAHNGPIARVARRRADAVFVDDHIARFFYSPLL